MITPVITSGIGGQPGTLIIGLPDTTEDTDTVFVGFGLAALNTHPKMRKNHIQ